MSYKERIASEQAWIRDVVGRGTAAGVDLSNKDAIAEWVAAQPMLDGYDERGSESLRIRASVNMSGSLSASNDAFAQQDAKKEAAKKLAHALESRAGAEGDFKWTEAGDAEAFAFAYGKAARHDHRRSIWLGIDASGVWREIDEALLTEHAILVARARIQAAAAIVDDDARKRALKHAMDGERRSRLTNMVAIARDLRPVANWGDGWDVDPFLVGAANGVVDLRTGALRRGLPEDCVSRSVVPAFDPAATCPTWERVVADVLDHDETLIAFFRRAVGYTLTGDMREEVIFFAHGPGGGGKGTVLGTLQWLLGSYADSLGSEAVLRGEKQTASNAASPEVAKLPGLRMVLVSEFDENDRFNVGRINAWSGRDVITARALYGSPFSFTPSFKIWMMANERPRIQAGQDNGIWRRLRMIPFRKSFAAPDRSLKDALRAEAPGILAWIVRGAMEWQAHGLGDLPEAVAKETASYKESSDKLAPFLSARCVVQGGSKVQGQQLWRAYVEWHASAVGDEFRLGHRKFFEAVGTRFAKDERRGVAWYGGVGLREDLLAEDTGP